MYFEPLKQCSLMCYLPHTCSCKVFLPDEYCDTLGISTEVEREHRRLVGKSTQECINDVIDGCTRLLTYHGVFFDISVSA